MDTEPRFFERRLDRSAYGACWWVAFITLAAFSLGAWLLWDAGTYLRRHQFWTTWHMPSWHFHKPEVPSSQSLIDQAKQAADKKASDAAASAAASAQQQVDKAVQTATASAASGASQQLNQFLGH